MNGIAYGAQSAGSSPGMWSANGQPLLDVKVGERYVLVASEEPYASEIAEQIAAASSWEDLPEVEFESYQIVGAGR